MPDSSYLQTVAMQAAAAAGVPAEIFLPQIEGESGWNPEARNSVGLGHVGLGQFDPPTAAKYGVDPTNPEQSLYGAARYMADLYKTTGSWEGALKAYVGAKTEGGLQRVLATNPGYAKAFTAAGSSLGVGQAPSAGNPLAPGLSGLSAHLSASPINALSAQEVAASPATPPTSTAGSLTPSSPLASSVALMALAAAGTHKFIPVEYNPFKMMQAAENPEARRLPITAAPAVEGSPGRVPVGTVAAPAATAPVRYLTKTGMRGTYQLPGMELGSGAVGSGGAADPAMQNWLAGIGG